MTETEQALVTAALKTAWYAGFSAARHYPNHAQPRLSVHWDGRTAEITPNWSAGQTNREGWIG